MIEAKVRKKVGASFSLDAELADGGFISLVGKNGSGKSSLLRAISGRLPLDEGFVRLDGEDVTKAPPEKRGVVMVTPSSSIPHLMVDDHLRWGARMRKVQVDPGRLNRVKTELGIDYSGRVRTLSLGMRERVALATSLLAAPRVILVDEAFSNLHERRDFISVYRRLTSDARIDVVYTTQEEADASLGDHVYSISEGKTKKRER